jgi:hypothetical protein
VKAGSRRHAARNALADAIRRIEAHPQASERAQRLAQVGERVGNLHAALQAKELSEEDRRRTSARSARCCVKRNG